jgi:hypothetical protein
MGPNQDHMRADLEKIEAEIGSGQEEMRVK